MEFLICVVGCGNIANGVHGPAYRKFAALHQNVRLAGCCDKDEERARRFKDDFGFDGAFTDIQEMLDTVKPDAVCLNAPAHLTMQLAQPILELGYPLLIEKPPGINAEETRTIIEAALKGQVPNQVAFNRRYMPVVTKLKELLVSNHRPQDIQLLRYDLFRVKRTDRDFAETAIHGIDTARFLAQSDYRELSFHYDELPQFGEGVANIYITGHFESGAAVQLSFCPMAGITMERATVNLLDNTYFAQLPIWNSVDSPGVIQCFSTNNQTVNISGDQLTEDQSMHISNGFYQENESFFLDIINLRAPAGSVETALQSVEIADCIRHRIGEYRK